MDTGLFSGHTGRAHMPQALPPLAHSSLGSSLIDLTSGPARQTVSPAVVSGGGGASPSRSDYSKTVS